MAMEASSGAEDDPTPPRDCTPFKWKLPKLKWKLPKLKWKKKIRRSRNAGGQRQQRVGGLQKVFWRHFTCFGLKPDVLEDNLSRWQMQAEAGPLLKRSTQIHSLPRRADTLSTEELRLFESFQPLAYNMQEREQNITDQAGPSSFPPSEIQELPPETTKRAGFLRFLTSEIEEWGLGTSSVSEIEEEGPLNFGGFYTGPRWIYYPPKK